MYRIFAFCNTKSEPSHVNSISSLHHILDLTNVTCEGTKIADCVPKRNIIPTFLIRVEGAYRIAGNQLVILLQGKSPKTIKTITSCSSCSYITYILNISIYSEKTDAILLCYSLCYCFTISVLLL